MNYDMITALAAILSALTVAISVLLIFFQLRRMRLSQDISVVLKLYERSTSLEMLEAASWVRTQMPEKFGYSDFLNNYEARRKLQQLWYHFEFIGVLVNKNYVNEDLIFDQQGSFIAAIWDKTAGLIYARRQKKICHGIWKTSRFWQIDLQNGLRHINQNLSRTGTII